MIGTGLFVVAGERIFQGCDHPCGGLGSLVKYLRVDNRRPRGSRRVFDLIDPCGVQSLTQIRILAINPIHSVHAFGEKDFNGRPVHFPGNLTLKLIIHVAFQHVPPVFRRHLPVKFQLPWTLKLSCKRRKSIVIEGRGLSRIYLIMTDGRLT